jgi:hypothetical protein
MGRSGICGIEIVAGASCELSEASSIRCRGSRYALYLLRVDAVQLAHELARRMWDVVPPGIGVTVERDMLWFNSARHSGKAGTYACQWLYQGQGEPEQLLAEACRRALDDLQDFVDEATTEPWPGSRTVPYAGTRVEDGKVLLWYGDRDAPVLLLEPLPLDA